MHVQTQRSEEQDEGFSELSVSAGPQRMDARGNLRRVGSGDPGELHERLSSRSSVAEGVWACCYPSFCSLMD